MKKVLSILVTAAMVITMFSGSAFADPGNGNGKGKDKFQAFTDMEGHWGKKSVEDLQSLGILDGYSDGTFKPDKTLTQGELAVIISRILDLRQGNDDQDLEDDQDTEDEDAIDDKDLDDVPAWAKDAVLKGHQKHYLNLKRFHSQVQCDRLTACVWIAKALELEPVTDLSDVPFRDRAVIGDDNLGYLLALYNEGYIKGYPDGNFNPNYILSRAQIASIIDKLLNGDDEVTNDDTAPTWDSDSKVTADEIGSTSVRLKWTEADDDTGVVAYKVLYEVNGTEKIKNVLGRTATITGLEPRHDYTFTVKARDAAGNWSDDDNPSVHVTTLEADEDSTKPSWDDDSYVTATAIRADSVDLKWHGASDDADVIAYKVIYKYNDVQKVKNVGDVTSVRISGLAVHEVYTFIVEAKDTAGNWSTDGPSVEVTTLEEDAADTTAPTWPHDAALDISEDSGIVTIEWPDADDNEGVTAYKFYKNDEFFTRLDNDVNKVRISGLDPNTEYTFTVRAIDAAGNHCDLEETYLTD